MRTIKATHWLFCCLLLVSNNLLAQYKNAATYVITKDSGNYINVPPKYWQILKDKPGNLSINQISSPEYDTTFSIYDPAANFDYTIKTIWFKANFRNALPHKVSLSFFGWREKTELYFKDSTGKWLVQKTGWMMPFDESDGYKKTSNVFFSLNPGEEKTIYEKRFYQFRVPSNITNSIHFENDFVKIKYINNEADLMETITMSFMFAIGIITCIINLLFFRVIREKEYLYYAIFMLTLGINSCIPVLELIGLKNYPLFVYYFRWFNLAVMLFFMMQFTRAFFKTKEIFPKWDKALITMNFLIILRYLLIDIENQSPTWEYNLILITIASIPYLFWNFILITLLLVIFKKDREYTSIAFAAVPIFILFGPVYSILWINNLLDIILQKPLPAWNLWLKDRRSFLTLIGTFWLIIIFSTLLFKRYRILIQQLADESFAKEKMAKEKEIEKNQLIAEKNAELEEKVANRTAALNNSLETIKATQKQLIASEKMAALGELTAGIAHEIQNPLNFVNNFSEVNKELLVEMKDEIDKGNLDQVRVIANDVIDNEEKINHHGKRADSIVKGMLQHSRSSSGVKEPTDINALANEYLRLSYNGLRAKDKSFNATLIPIAIGTDFDESIGNINIVPQDIGRVLLNLFNNAFYACTERPALSEAGVSRSAAPLPPEGGFLDPNYLHNPTIWVSTKKMDGQVLISVKDNGPGIPQKILDKIFQPFFTTKPTGQGTGLGLSLSYDIVKAHGGELKINSREGEGAEFIIHLPII